PAQSAFAAGNAASTVPPVEAGLGALRSLRAQLATLGLNPDARFEIDFRLQNKERDVENAVLAAHNLTFDAIADDGLVVRGQSVRVSVGVLNRAAPDVTVTGVILSGFD